MRKNTFFTAGVLVIMLVLALVLIGCPNDSGNNNSGNTGNTGNTGGTGNGTVNLQNEHNSDTIYWFEMKKDGIVTIGESVEIKPYFSKQFQVPAGTYIAGVTAGSATDLRQCTVSISGGQVVTLVFNGGLSQR